MFKKTKTKLLLANGAIVVFAEVPLMQEIRPGDSKKKAELEPRMNLCYTCSQAFVQASHAIDVCPRLCQSPSYFPNHMFNHASMDAVQVVAAGLAGRMSPLPLLTFLPSFFSPSISLMKSSRVEASLVSQAAFSLDREEVIPSRRFLSISLLAISLAD